MVTFPNNTGSQSKAKETTNYSIFLQNKSNEKLNCLHSEIQYLRVWSSEVTMHIMWEVQFCEYWALRRTLLVDIFIANQVAIMVPCAHFKNPDHQYCSACSGQHPRCFLLKILLEYYKIFKNKQTKKTLRSSLPAVHGNNQHKQKVNKMLVISMFLLLSLLMTTKIIYSSS